MRGQAKEQPLAIEILYEDNHLLAVLKPAGLLTQGDRTGDPTALDAGKAHIRATSHRPGNVFLGLVHRIDRPVSGVLVFARTSKAASRLARSFHDRKVEKTYLAVVVGRFEEEIGRPGRLHRAHALAIATGTGRVGQGEGGHSFVSGARVRGRFLTAGSHAAHGSAPPDSVAAFRRRTPGRRRLEVPRAQDTPRPVDRTPRGTALVSAPGARRSRHASRHRRRIASRGRASAT